MFVSMKLGTDILEKKSRVTQVTLLFFLLLATSCSTSTRQLFFDIPQPSAAELAEQRRLDQEQREQTLDLLEDQDKDKKSLFSGAFDDNLPRPAIESLSSWEQALEMLPKDYKKDADWAAAVEQGVVRPRTGADPTALFAAAFKYDFIIAADKPKNEAYFPHSAHTAWLGCKNCHMKLYPYKRNPAKMKEMKKGASCGTCHGKNKVAFSLSQCKRCHLNR
jgi:c(7)-type cytochrome triheme protein